jgi:hypothetical protein
MSDWYGDGTGAWSLPEGKIPVPLVERESPRLPSSRLHPSGASDDRSCRHTLPSCRRDSQSVQRNSPLRKEKAPCVEPFGSLMGSQHDQRGGGPDERTNKGTRDSCHRSHVRALITNGRDISFVGRARSTRQAVKARTGKERPGLQRAHQGQVLHRCSLAGIRKLSRGVCAYCAELSAKWSR